MEQTTSCAWPNTVVAKYFNSIGEYPSEEIKQKTELMLSESYQRLLTFQQNNGGFSLWCGEGGGADVHFTALGLMQLSEMSEVTFIDPKVIASAAEYLASQQAAGGTWDDLMHTAAIAWALAAGGQQGQMLDKALNLLRNESLMQQEDGKPAIPVYTRALAAIALALADPDDQSVDLLIASLVADVELSGDQAHWQAGETTLFGSYGQDGNVVGTGVVAYLLLLTGHEIDLAEKAVSYIVSRKTAYGGWGATENTVAALRALSLSDAFAQGTVSVSCHGEPYESIELAGEDAEILNIVDLDGCLSDQTNPWEFTFEGLGKIQYQFEGTYHTEFEDPPPPDDFILDVGYLPASPKQGDAVTATVAAGNGSANDHGMVIITVPVPLGMSVRGSQLDGLKADGVIQEWEVRARQVTIYLEQFPAGSQTEFTFEMAATLPMKTVIAAATIYSYYNPSVRTVTEPVDMIVAE